MKQIALFILILFSMFLLTACSQSPKDIYRQAENSYKLKDYSSALSKLNIILKDYPGSPETGEAQSLINKINDEIELKEKIEKAKKEKTEREKKNKIYSLTRLMRTSRDDIRSLTWYYDRTTPRYADVKAFYVYIAKDDSGDVALRLKIQYSADEWLFVNNYIINIDGTNYSIKPDKVERDNYTNIWEWCDIPASNYLSIIKAIITSKKAVLRYEGDKYYSDKIITSQEKAALKRVLDLYGAFKA